MISSIIYYITVSPYGYSLLGIIGLIVYYNEKIELLIVGSIGIIMYVFIYPYLKILKKISLEEGIKPSEEKEGKEFVENKHKKSLDLLKRVYFIGNIIMTIVIVLCFVLGT